MKNIYALLLLLIPLSGFCNQNAGFNITGTIQGLDTGTIELIYRNHNGDDTTITAGITGGKFKLTGKIPEPELARFNIRTGWVYNMAFFLENTEQKISLVKNDDSQTKITGSYSNTIFETLEPQQRRFFADARNYDNAHQQAINNHNAQAAIAADSVWAAQQHQWFSTIRSAITAEPKNYAGLYFIKWLLFHPPGYDTIMSLFMRLDPVVRNGPSGKDFMTSLQHYKKISVGQPAPEISGKDTSGNPQKLSSLKGQIVLLDFWASYCGICRQTNPQLKAVYEKYHAAGFEILSVSLDYERSAWVKAIQADKLPWPQVSELRGGAAASAGVYDVQDLPRNWLIDRNGNIIAHDLSIADLSQRLEQLLRVKGK